MCDKCIIKEAEYQYGIKLLETRIALLMGFIEIHGLKEKLEDVLEACDDKDK